MRNSTRWIAILLIAIILCGCGKKEPVAVTAPAVPEDTVIATVNGEKLMASDFEPYRQQYLESYSAMGLSLSDQDALAYIDDAALTACIQDLLFHQDILAQGCYEFDEATLKWLQDSGEQAYEEALLNVEDYLRTTLDQGADTDLSEAAKTYAAAMGVSAEDYIQVFFNQFAITNYNTWLMKDDEITDADVMSAYEADVEASKERFANDVNAFEKAIEANEAVWYQPEGYRSILQILLRAEGSSDEERLASVATTISRIYERLNAGESFTALIREYGSDANFDSDDFLATGYSVHKDSVVWEDAFIQASFADELNVPGTWSQTPFVSDAGVHILYYLKDNPGGPVELTDGLKDAITYTLYQERLDVRYAQRLEELSSAAEVVYSK